jgi:hypothetical protein
MKKQTEITNQEDEQEDVQEQEYTVTKDFVSKTDGKEYRVGSKIFVSGTRVAYLTETGFINAIPVKEL